MDAVAVSAGPGAYTSLRIGTSTAKGLAYALEKPLIAVDTLQALAWASREWLGKNAKFVLDARPLFLPMIDARRMEVVVAIFDENLRLLQAAEPKILSNEMFEKFHANGSRESGLAESGRVLVLAGNGSPKSRGVFNSKEYVFSEIENCSVQHLTYLAEKHFQSADFQSLAYFEPLYMKPPNITTAGNPQTPK